MWLSVSSVLIFWPFFLRLLFPSAPQELLPAFAEMAIGVVAWWALGEVQNMFAKVIGVLWFLWLLVGTVNTVASYEVLGLHYNIVVGPAVTIYWLFTLAYVLGILLFEYLNRTKHSQYGVALTAKTIPSSVITVSYLFPLVWLGSMYLSLGFIPILSGRNIVNEIYSLPYGPMYPYTAFISVSLIILFVRAMDKSAALMKMSRFSFLAIFCGISIADGKRQVLVLFVFAAFAYLIKIRREKVWAVSAPALVSLLLASYVFIAFARIGFDIDRYLIDFHSQLTIIGVEFRDFVFSTNYFLPGSIDNYSWGESAIGSMLNHSLLGAFGFSKDEMVLAGSAYVWKGLFDSDFGIRTGIVSELWFAYGYWGIGLMVSYGSLTGWVARLLGNTRSRSSFVFLSLCFALIISSIMGQTTVSLGVFILFAYLWLGLVISKTVISQAVKKELREW